MHKLLIEDDEGKTVAVPLIREEITIGRVEGNTIRLTEQNVSRKHARLTLRGGALRLEDLGSYNGTSLNGSLISGVAALKDGDVILIGDYRLGIQEEKTDKAAPPPSTPTESLPAAPAVADVMEGQPTIPISTLTAQTAFSEPPARLVVTSRFLSGAEFVLDRISAVIGRTPENDIVINHKSISRHHAKIVREGNRYTILDLESANGVRVGGTDHDRVDLQSGDVIELGEVRLRFLSGDAGVYDEPQAWYQNKKILAIALGGAAVGLGVVTMILLSHGSGSSVPAPPVAPPVASAPPSPPPPPVAPVVQPTQPTPPPAAEPPPPPVPTVPTAELLAEAKKSAKAEKWDEALATVGKAITQEPGSIEAAELKKTIEVEKARGEKLVALTQSLADKDFDAVLQGTAEIPDESMYKAKAAELHKTARTQFIVAHLEAAKDKLAANDCDEARREAELVIGQDAKNKKATGIIKRCEAMQKVAQAEPVAEAPKPAPKPAPVPVASKPAARHVAAVATARSAAPKNTEPPKVDATPPGDPDKLIKDAQQAWFHGQYAAAIDSARKALRAKPNLMNAYQIIAVCSCALHDADGATRAYEKLDERNKVFVKTACQKNGIGF